MRVTELGLPGVLLLEPRVHVDDRGRFMEDWNEGRYRSVGICEGFVQDNISWSKQGVLRGLHYQHPRSQSKLVSVLHGEVFDVVVDVRKGSPTFGKWLGCGLSGASPRQLYVPAGLAHGFAVLSKCAIFSYKCGEYYSPDAEETILWNDPEIGIDWPLLNPVLSEKDREGTRLRDVPAEGLPPYE